MREGLPSRREHTDLLQSDDWGNPALPELWLAVQKLWFAQNRLECSRGLSSQTTIPYPIHKDYYKMSWEGN